MSERPKSFEAWQETISEAIRNSSLWEYQAYPKALFLYELAWFDCQQLPRDPRGRAIAEQLIRSAGSICANIGEALEGITLASLASP